MSLCLALYLEFRDGVLRTNGISFCLSPLTPSPITFFFVFGSAIARLYLFLSEPLLIMLIWTLYEPQMKNALKKTRQQRRLKPKIYRRESTHSDKTGTSDFVERLTILAVNRKSIVKRYAFRFSVRGIRDLGMSPIPLLFPWIVPSTFTHAMKSSESKKERVKNIGNWTSCM